MSPILSSEDYSEIESVMSGKKLYFVRLEAEHELYVIASSVDEAKKEGLANRRNLLDSDEWDASASEIKSNSHINDYWIKECPFGDEEITCGEIINYLREKERKKKIAEELDKKQLKFEFV